jgi:hypothetical protein
LFEGSGGVVELAAIEFDGEVLVSVDGVDLVAGDGLVALGGAAGGGVSGTG